MVLLSMALEKELEFFRSVKADLMKNHAGKFVLIHCSDVCGTYDTAENAYVEGIKRFGREPFLIKKITEEEEVYRNQALSIGLMNARI